MTANPRVKGIKSKIANLYEKGADCSYLPKEDLEYLLQKLSELEGELADHKKNHNTQKWTELLNKRMDQIKALESQVSRLRDVLGKILNAARKVIKDDDLDDLEDTLEELEGGNELEDRT